MTNTAGDMQDQPSDANQTDPHGTPNGAQAATAELSIEAQLAEAKAKADQYLDGWQRARADFANYKKRADKERDEIYQRATVETLVKFLPVIDDFDRAIANVPADKVGDEAAKGLVLIHRKLSGLLEAAGIKIINPLGEVFNPAYHEALGRDDVSSVASGHVSAVLQKGYTHGDRVLRPALVRVAN